jgi:tetratricopeptide (TPR) repeat protein
MWPVEEATARGNLGALWVRDGKLQTALEPLETAVKLLETVSASHPNLPAILQSLADVYAGLRQYREADEALARALRIQTALTGEENELVVQMLHARSAVLERIDRKEEAAQLPRHADGIWKSSSALRAARDVVDVAKLQRH